MQINPLVLFVSENHLSRCEKTPRELTALSGYNVSCSCCVHRTLLKEINQNNKKLGGTGWSLTQHNKSETITLVYFAKNVCAEIASEFRKVVRSISTLIVKKYLIEI